MPDTQPSPTIAAPAPQVNADALPEFVRGLNTTEFWVLVFSLGALVISALTRRLNPNEAACLGTLLTAGYNFLRVWLKARHLDAAADALSAVAQSPNFQQQGGAAWSARDAHNVEVTGSNPVPATLPETRSARELNNQSPS